VYYYTVYYYTVLLYCVRSNLIGWDQHTKRMV